MNLPKELMARIAEHLSDVRKNLISLPPDERQEILQSIESHIYDALESRSNDETTPALLEAVIAEMDPPDSYGERPPTKQLGSVMKPFVSAALALTAGLVIWVAFGISKGSFLAHTITTAESKHPPVVVSTFPLKGNNAIDPNITELRVTFNKDMLTDRMWSWCIESQDTAPKFVSEGTKFIDKRTCVTPVELEPNKTYVVWINTQKHDAFRDIYHNPAIPYRLEFRTSSAKSNPYPLPTKQPPELTSDLIGHWQSVDFVESIEQFDPGTKGWRGDLYLKELTFLPDGKTDRPFWTWKDDVLHHSGDNTDAKFFIKKISGEDCLFLEWISGDVTKKGLPPKYYVLKRASTESQQQAEELHKDTETEKADILKGTTMKRPLTLAAVSILAATNLLAEEPREDFSLQEAINNASAGDTIIIPAGTYTQPVIIRKKITLDGQSVIFKVVANQPAIQIDTSEPVSLKNLEIQYQSKSKPQKGEFPYAVYASGGDLLIEDCVFKGSGNSEAVPCAVLATERSTLHIKNSRFDGFDYTVQLWNGSNGSIEDCLIINPGHCGITIGEGSSATLKHNIVTGSRYHAIRCTGGKIIADSNLIADNKNRGFYIGNKSATGTLSNNLIINNAVGINVFAYSDLEIANNTILRSSYAGLSLADSAKLAIKDNVIMGNETGFVGFSAEQGREPSIKLNGKNLVHGNTVESEKIELSSRTLTIDPLFSDPGTGLFATTESEADGMGLTSPTDMQVLWKKWQAAISR